MLVAVENASGQSIDSFGLIALRFVGAYELKVHGSIIWEQLLRVVDALPCKYGLWWVEMLNFILSVSP